MPTCSSGTSTVTSSIGSSSLAVGLAGDDLGVAELQLVALAAHRLDEDGELQLAAAVATSNCRASRRRLDAEREVLLALLLEALASGGR
jgi:hypothetical protein